LKGSKIELTRVFAGKGVGDAHRVVKREQFWEDTFAILKKAGRPMEVREHAGEEDCSDYDEGAHGVDRKRWKIGLFS